MKKEALYLFIILICITTSVIQCTKSNNLKKLEVLNLNIINIDNTSPISLVTIIPKGEKATFLMGTTKEELKTQPTMDHTDYYTQ